MRIIKEVSHPQCKITVFFWNGKYLVKLERGLIEQTYKIPETEISGEQDIDKLLQSQFLDKVLIRFEEMENDFMEALENIQA